MKMRQLTKLFTNHSEGHQNQNLTELLFYTLALILRLLSHLTHFEYDFTLTFAGGGGNTVSSVLFEAIITAQFLISPGNKNAEY